MVRGGGLLGPLNAAQELLGDSVAEIGVSEASCHIGASNLVSGFLLRLWGSVSYEIGNVEDGHRGDIVGHRH